MFMDADLLFSDAQAVTATAASTNYYDTGPLYSGNTGRSLGVVGALLLHQRRRGDDRLGLGQHHRGVTRNRRQHVVLLDRNRRDAGDDPGAHRRGHQVFRARSDRHHRAVRALHADQIHHRERQPDHGFSFTVALVKNIDNWTSYVSAVSTGI
jgi:hypothetical protein